MLQADSFSRSWIPFGFFAHIQRQRAIDLPTFLQLSGKLCSDLIWPKLVKNTLLSNCEGGPLTLPPKKRPLFSLEGDIPSQDGNFRPWAIQGFSRLDSVSFAGGVKASSATEIDNLFHGLSPEIAITQCHLLAPIRLQSLSLFLNFYRPSRFNLLAALAPLLHAEIELRLTPMSLDLRMKLFSDARTLFWDSFPKELQLVSRLFP